MLKCQASLSIANLILLTKVHISAGEGKMATLIDTITALWAQAACETVLIRYAESLI